MRTEPMGIDKLSCAAINETSVDFDWSEGYGEKWDIVLPDVSDWSLEKCREYLEDQGVGIPGIPVECIAVEYDPEYTGGDYDGTGETVYLPVSKIGEHDTEDAHDIAVWSAFKEATGLDSIHIVHYSNEVVTVLDDEEFDESDDDHMEPWRDAVREQMQGDGSDGFAPMMNYYYPLPYLSISPEAAQEAVMDTACTVVMVDDEPVLALAGGGMDLSPDICKAYFLLGYYPPLHFASNLPGCGTYAKRRAGADVLAACVESARIAEGWARDARERLEKFASDLD
jgi:hypothetical protein